MVQGEDDDTRKTLVIEEEDLRSKRDREDSVIGDV
jgi:hypothetical protein